MSVLGIIAEFNPFHKGHEHLINTAKKNGSFDAVVCVMSGNFSQRAEPAVCDKWSRAEMALQGGVDLVIELTFAFAVRSAYYFARGAVQLLARTGVITHLGFGSENGQLDPLLKIASLLANEPDEYRNQLKDLLGQGLSYPAARSRALQHYFGPQAADLAELMNGPNNILAIEYLHNIIQDQINLQPFTISRQGDGYHSQQISGSGFSSAGAIRTALLNDPVITEKIEQALPESSRQILEREISMGRAPISPNALEQIVLANLRSMSLSSLSQIYEISEGLEYRIKEASLHSGTLEELRRKIKSKRYSLTRINRILIYSLFHLTKEQIDILDQHGPQYFHILAFSSTGRKILQKIKNKSSLPILSRGSQVKKLSQEQGSSEAGDLLALDILASDIYSLLSPASAMRGGGKDFLTSSLFIG